MNTSARWGSNYSIEDNDEKNNTSTLLKETFEEDFTDEEVLEELLDEELIDKDLSEELSDG